MPNREVASVAPDIGSGTEGWHGACIVYIRAFFHDSLDYPGILGAHMISPPPGFADEQERDDFYASELFKKWQEHVAHLTEGDRTSVRCTD